MNTSYELNDLVDLVTSAESKPCPFCGVSPMITVQPSPRSFGHGITVYFACDNDDCGFQPSTGQDFYLKRGEEHAEDAMDLLERRGIRAVKAVWNKRHH